MSRSESPLQLSSSNASDIGSSSGVKHLICDKCNGHINDAWTEFMCNHVFHPGCALPNCIIAVCPICVPDPYDALTDDKDTLSAGFGDETTRLAEVAWDVLDAKSVIHTYPDIMDDDELPGEGC